MWHLQCCCPASPGPPPQVLSVIHELNSLLSIPYVFCLLNPMTFARLGFCSFSFIAYLQSPVQVLPSFIKPLKHFQFLEHTPFSLYCKSIATLKQQNRICSGFRLFVFCFVCVCTCVVIVRIYMSKRVYKSEDNHLFFYHGFPGSNLVGILVWQHLYPLCHFANPVSFFETDYYCVQPRQVTSLFCSQSRLTSNSSSYFFNYFSGRIIAGTITAGLIFALFIHFIWMFVKVYVCAPHASLVSTEVRGGHWLCWNCSYN